MSLFTECYNLENRTLEWSVQNLDYDFQQEIARSGYADMLWDKERNEKYFNAIKTCVDYLRKKNKEVHVLDIGTGTGLLSMMAASCKVDSITACEGFYPMYECATKILSENNFADKIKVIPKMSTELEVGPDKDMIRKANLLVAELLDTELIGEGAIQCYIHAKENLLEEDALLVPTSATVYGQIITSKSVLNWNRMQDLEYSCNNEKLMISIPSEITSCHGYEFHDIQLSELPLKNFEPLSDPVPCCKIDWTGRDISLKNDDRNVTRVKPLKNGMCHAVFMWWDIEMESVTHDVLSCAPYWAHPLNKENNLCSMDIPWRDHWMQAVYFLPKTLSANIGEELSLITYHDSYSFWFDIDSCIEVAPEMQKPMCECYLHLTISGNRMAQLSNTEYIDFFAKLLHQHVTHDSVCLFIGDFCLHALYAVNIGAKHVYITELPFHNEVLKKIIVENRMEDKITILPNLDNLCIEDLIKPVDLVIGEPFFEISFLPWENLQFWKLKDKIRHVCSSSAKILPDKCEIKCVPVQFRDLWKIYSPVQSTCGFNLDYFNQIILEARKIDANVEPKPLWEYPCRPLGPDVSLMTLNLTESIPTKDINVNSTIIVDDEGVLNGLVIWADWFFGEHRYTTGPVNYAKDKIEWNPFVKQGVHFPEFSKTVEEGGKLQVSVSTLFNPKKCTCFFNIEEAL